MAIIASSSSLFPSQFLTILLAVNSSCSSEASSISVLSSSVMVSSRFLGGGWCNRIYNTINCHYEHEHKMVLGNPNFLSFHAHSSHISSFHLLSQGFTTLADELVFVFFQHPVERTLPVFPITLMKLKVFVVGFHINHSISPIHLENSEIACFPNNANALQKKENVLLLRLMTYTILLRDQV